jgi:hypothetical protein
VICDIDEFLSVLHKWTTERVKVVFVLMVFDNNPSTPFLGGRLRGVVSDIDRDLPGFSFSGGEHDVLDAVVVDLRNWAIGYADKRAFARSNPYVDNVGKAFAAENVGEAFTLNRPGASIGLWTVTPD